MSDSVRKYGLALDLLDRVDTCLLRAYPDDDSATSIRLLVIAAALGTVDGFIHDLARAVLPILAQHHVDIHGSWMDHLREDDYAE